MPAARLNQRQQPCRAFGHHQRPTALFQSRYHQASSLQSFFHTILLILAIEPLEPSSCAVLWRTSAKAQPLPSPTSGSSSPANYLPRYIVNSSGELPSFTNYTHLLSQVVVSTRTECVLPFSTSSVTDPGRRTCARSSKQVRSTMRRGMGSPSGTPRPFRDAGVNQGKILFLMTLPKNWD